jgi:hypothetical protein
LLHQIKTLDEENAKLRNTLLGSNEEIFSLNAVVATIEAESKFNLEKETTKMQSELNFRVSRVICYRSYVIGHMF